MGSIRVEPRVIVDASEQFGIVRGVHETNVDRALNLIIKEDGQHFRLRIQTSDPELLAALGEDIQRAPLIPLTRTELAGHVQECRQTWMSKVVNRLVGEQLLFQNAWNLAASPEILNDALPDLAKAGAKLFLAIFYPQRMDGGEDDEILRRIGKILRDEMARVTRWVRVSSSSFFAPWSLIYSEPVDRDNIRLEGFWGYQHMVEHTPSDSGSLGNELAFTQPLRIGLQIDQTIDTELDVSCLKPVRELLASYAGGLLQEERPLRDIFEQALRSGPPADQILYFCCHAQQEGDATAIRQDQSYLILSDRPEELLDNRITPTDIRMWMDMNTFRSSPLVFLNTCGGGQMNSLFYESFGRMFLGLQASAVVGPQTEAPAVFAGEFGRRFLAAFFEGGRDRQVGKILFQLRREFLTVHHNPLGMIYSLYRGADVFLPVGLRKSDS